MHVLSARVASPPPTHEGSSSRKEARGSRAREGRVTIAPGVSDHAPEEPAGFYGIRAFYARIHELLRLYVLLFDSHARYARSDVLPSLFDFDGFDKTRLECEMSASTIILTDLECGIIALNNHRGWIMQPKFAV